MYYDAHGRPTSDGDYEMIGGRLCLRSGRAIGFSVAFMDSASRSATTSGRDQVAAARRARCADKQTAYCGPRTAGAAPARRAEPTTPKQPSLADSRASVAAARNTWLQAKGTAYLGRH